MKNFIEIKAIRNYDIIKSGVGLCDLCKGYKELYDFEPQIRLHNFDNIFLCKTCSIKCNFDIREGALDGIFDDKRRD